MVSLRAQTGIKSLDEALDGGLRFGSLCLVTGPGREVLAQQFFYSGLELGEACIYVTTKSFHTEIIDMMTEKGWNIAGHEDRYMIIDTYTPQSDASVQDLPQVKFVPSLADFAKLSNCIVSTMSDYLTKGIYQQRISFDSIDTMLMYVSPAGVYRFLSYLRAKIKGFKATGFFLIDPGLHEEKDVRTIMQLADVVIELKPATEEILINQLGLPKKNAKYAITNEGVEVTIKI
ncbi:MAG: RAD55 family ATPase [Thermoplasmata archaeon]